VNDKVHTSRRWRAAAELGRYTLGSVVLLFALLVSGCVRLTSDNLSAVCHFDNPSDWSVLPRAPAERKELLSQLKKEDSYGQYVVKNPGGRIKWFEAAGGARLGYCYLPEYPSSCNNYTVTFARRGNSWERTKEASMWVVCAD
jgi:hypothetical protein